MKTLTVLLSLLFYNLPLAMAKMQTLPDYATVTLRNVKSSKYMEVFKGQYTRYYSPIIHPESDNGRNELLLTYCLNFSACRLESCEGDYLDPYYYRVKGILVPYAKIGL